MLLSATAAIQLLCVSLVAQTAVSTVADSRTISEHDPFSGAIEVLHHTFSSDEDLDYDGQPDEWSRRTGAGFPQYIDVEIDTDQGYRSAESKDNWSLQIAADGGRATLYSMPKPLGAYHSYVLRARVRTEQLQHDAAMITVWFLNHQRVPVQRFETRPATGTHDDWVHVEILSMVPNQDVEFVVIGCHLVPGDKADIGGAAWFDDIWLGKLPHMTVVSNHHRHFVEPDADIVIRSNIMGLDPRRRYDLHLELLDSNKEIIQQEDRNVYSPRGDQAEVTDEDADKFSHKNIPPEVWTLPPQNYGYYQVLSQLKRDGAVILEKQASFAVMDLVQESSKYGEFGWSVRRPVKDMSSDRMVAVAHEAGINWIKYPLWRSVHSRNNRESDYIVRLFDGMKLNGIAPVGVLNNPPTELRKQFVHDWAGVSEIFTMQPSFWRPWLEPVIARYSSRVRYWQLGDDSDSSFVGLKSLPDTISLVKREFDLIGRDTRVGFRWDWGQELPRSRQLPQSFLTLHSEDESTTTELTQRLDESRKSGMPRWVLLKPLARSDSEPEVRGGDLVKKMVAAKFGEADAIFAYDVFDAEHGLLNANGSPTLLFLPWRTTAIALQGAEFLGSFQMPNGSQNFAFARADEVVLIVWNDSGTDDAPVVEELYLGEEVTATNVWGQQWPIPRDEESGRHKVAITATPLVIRGCSKPIAKWRLAAKFNDSRLASQQEGQQRLVVGQNTFGQSATIKMSLDVPQEWKLDRRNWKGQFTSGQLINLPITVSLPPNVTLGQEKAWINFDIQADQQYKIRVFRSFEVGLGDVEIDIKEEQLADGRLKVTQFITNKTSPVEELSFRCSLNIPGRKRMARSVFRLGNSVDKQIYYIPKADEIKGEQLWLRAKQSNGKRNLNYRWTVGRASDN